MSFHSSVNVDRRALWLGPNHRHGLLEIWVGHDAVAIIVQRLWIRWAKQDSHSVDLEANFEIFLELWSNHVKLENLREAKLITLMRYEMICLGS